MRWLIAAAALLCATPAVGQVAYPPLDPATVTRTATQAAQVALPGMCTQPPAQDATVATVGVGAACIRREDAAAATVVPPGVTTTGADGTFSGTWTGGPLDYIPSRGFATIYSTVAPYHCQLGTLTAAGYSGKCWQLVSTTLPNAPTALLSLVVSPFANPASGLVVNVFARK